MLVDVGGGQDQANAEEDGEQQQGEDMNRDYWYKPKEMDNLFMKQCQLGVNHQRVIGPVGALVPSGFSFLHFCTLSFLHPSILSWVYSFWST